MRALKLKHINAWLFVGTASLLMATQANAHDEDAPTPPNVPEEVSLESVTFAGTGCAAGTAEAQLARHGKRVKFKLNDFLVQAGPDVSRRENRKICRVLLDIEHTPGWQYAVKWVSYRGRIAAADGIAGLAKTAVYFQGQQENVEGEMEFAGPITEKFRVKETFDGADAVWSPCDADRALNLGIEARLNNRANPEAVGKVRLKGKRGVLLALKWKRCES